MPRPASTAQAPRASETQVLRGTFNYLWTHPLVGWVARRNTGGMYDKMGRYVAYGDLGDSDLYGYLKTAVHIEIEVKAPHKWPGHHLIDKWDAMPIWTGRKGKPRPAFYRSDYQHRIVRQRAALRRAWLCGCCAGVLEDVTEVDLIIGPQRMPVRLWPDWSNVPF